MDLMPTAHVFRELTNEQRLNLGVRAPAPWLSTGGDNLRVRSSGTANPEELIVAIRWLTLEGEIIPFAFRHVTATGGGVVETLHRLSDGWLLTATVQIAAGAVGPPGVFVRLDIVAGLANAVQLVGTLAQGYVSSLAAISYPLTPIVGIDASQGAPIVVLGANPGAGAEFSLITSANQRWRVLSVRAPLVTDATVAAREAQLTLVAGGVVLAVLPSGTAQAASEARDYCWFPGAPYGAGAVALNVTAPLPPVVLPPGTFIESLTTNLQAGDDWGPPVLLVMTSSV